MLNAYEFVKLQGELDTKFIPGYYRNEINPETGEYYKYRTLDDYIGVESVDWQGETFSPTWSQDHNISVTGGNDGTKYYAFITKPYNTAILLAKIAALLRRVYASEQSEILTWNDATLHLESSMIEYKGQKAELTKNELKILYYLFKSAGKICSRNDMVDFLWDNQLYIDDNALSVNITRIRNKLDYIGLHDFIKTKHRQGYTL